MEEEVAHMLDLIALSASGNACAPWLLTCSACGPIGVAHTDAAADLTLIRHGAEHATLAEARS